jgi:hypothetical protein
MIRFAHLGRLAAATLIVASAATVALTAPAGAADTAITLDCTTQLTAETVNNSDTVTATISGGACGFVIFDNGGATIYGTATLNNNALTLGNPVAVADGDVLVFTAPASGSDSNSFSFWPNLQSPPPIASLGITFPAPSGSIVDNADGTFTATYTGDINIYLFPAGTPCDDPFTGFNQNTRYILSNMGPGLAALAASPALIQAGTFAITGGGPPIPTPIAAGSYEACMYPMMSGTALIVGQTVTVGQVAPTTTTTTTGTDPVAPAFAG